MLIEGECGFNFDLLHHDERYAIGERIAFVLVAFQPTPTVMKYRCVDVEQLPGGAGHQITSDIDSLAMVPPRIKVATSSSTNEVVTSVLGSVK